MPPQKRGLHELPHRNGHHRALEWPGSGVRREHPRPGRQHPVGPAEQGHRGAPPSDPGQARAAQPGRERQGPYRPVDARGRGAERTAPAGWHRRRAHLGQHRPRTGDGGGDQGLQDDLRHARQDVVGEDQPAARVRRRGGHLPHQRRTGVGAVVLLGGGPDHPRGARGISAEPVLQSAKPGGALPTPPDRRSGGKPTAASRRSSPASAPGARSAASASTSRSRTRRFG